MKLLIAILICYTGNILAEPGWFSNIYSESDIVNDDMFGKAYKEAKSHLADQRKQVEEEEIENNKQVPIFETGSLGNFASNMLDSAKKATGTYIAGVRSTASEFTRSMIAATANTAIDLLLSEYKLLSSTTGIGSKLSLPDIKTSAYGCNLEATGGYFSSLSSLEKSGKIEVTILDSDSAILEIPMSFKEMRVGYDHFQVKAFMLLGTSGSFSINIAKNNLIIKLRLGMDSTCALSVERVTIRELDGITVKFEGLGSYANAITGKLSNLLISYLKDVIARHIQEAVDANLRTALDQNSMICSNFVPS